MYYAENEPTMVVSVLGTDYGIYIDVPESADETLKECTGYCDKTSHRIAVCEQEKDANLDDYSAYRKQVIRHELIHTFLFESGLGGDTAWAVQGQEHPEQMVDWLARQFPKLLKAFNYAGVL